MKKQPDEPRHPELEMREEYDFKGGVRGKYAKAYAEGTNLVPIDPEVAVFYCRQRLVLDSFEELGVDPDFNG
jgi:hypothetical protein